MRYAITCPATPDVIYTVDAPSLSEAYREARAAVGAQIGKDKAEAVGMCLKDEFLVPGASSVGIPDPTNPLPKGIHVEEAPWDSTIGKATNPAVQQSLGERKPKK